MRPNTSLRLFAALLVSMVALGCGDDSDDSKPRATDAVPTPDRVPAVPDAAPEPSDSEVQTSPRTASTIEEELREKIEIPSFYPEDGPVYPGAKPSNVQQLPSGRVNLVFGTDAMPAEASSIMSEAAEAKGWEVLSVDELERGLLARAQKNGRNLLILTNRVDDGSGEVLTLVAVSVDP